MRLLFDCEADGFLAEVTKVHCIGAVDVDTDQYYVWGPNEIPQALETLHKAEELIGHNIIRYDLLVLYKLYKFVPFDDTKITDTLVGARLAWPNVREIDAKLLITGKLPRKGSDDEPLVGRHTLEAWGYRLGEQKAHFDGPWGEWTQEMQDYMMQDVRTNRKLLQAIDKKELPEIASKLEHDMAVLCDVIEKEGCPFDLAAARKLHAELVGKKDVLSEKLREQFGFWLAPKSPTKFLFTPKKDNKKHGYVAGQECCKLKRVDFNPTSRDHAIYILKRQGWVPTEFTDAGKPKMDETIAAPVATEFPQFEGLAQYYMLDKRLQQLADGNQAWLKHCGEDGLIHGVINPMGCVTSRATHFNPNLGQVPSAKKPYGKECRALFRVPYEWVQIGADQDGLELRGLAHFLALTDDGEYANAVTTGDPHWLNAQGMGLVPMGTARDKHNPLHTILRESGSKRFIYAYIYGCGDEKAGRIILLCLLDAKRKDRGEGTALFREWFKSDNPSADALKRVGKRVRQEFASRIRGFSGLKTRIEHQVDKHGWVPGLDGRRIPTRSSHSALNFLIQGAGAIICKRWGVDAYAETKSKWKIGWKGDVTPMLWVHDEYQYAARKGLEKEIGEILVKHARSAGEPYGFRVPLDSKYTVGRSWADTH